MGGVLIPDVHLGETRQTVGCELMDDNNGDWRRMLVVSGTRGYWRSPWIEARRRSGDFPFERDPYGERKSGAACAAIDLVSLRW
jgi:hypothetical protein